MTLLLSPILAACTLVSDEEVEGKVQGWGLRLEEERPDDTVAEIDGNLELVLETLVAQDLGGLSGVGTLDSLDGTLALTGIQGWAANDADAFSFTVAGSQGATLSGSWENEASDLDFAIFGDIDGDGRYRDWFTSFGDSYCRTDTNPETCVTAANLSADTTYYLVVLGYTGTGEEPYHIELEWDP